MMWRFVKGKYVITKDGVNFAITLEQLKQLKFLIEDIESGRNELECKDNRYIKNFEE